MIVTSVLLILLAPLIHHCRSDLTLSVSRVGYPDSNDPENNVTLRCTDAGTHVSDANFTLNGTVIGLGVVQSYSQTIEEGTARFVITQGEEGYYACEKDDKVSNETTLIAYLKDYSSAPEQNIMASKGTPVLLPCPYQSGALKEHYAIEWIYKSLNLGIIYTIKQYEEQYEILEDYTLCLKNVSNEQSGTYHCRVVSTSGMGVNPRINVGPDIQFRIIQASDEIGSEMENSSKMESAKIIGVIITCGCVSVIMLLIIIAVIFKVRRRHGKCKVNVNTVNLESGGSCHRNIESITCAGSNSVVATESQHELPVYVMPPLQPNSSMTQLNSQKNRNEEAQNCDSVTLATDLLEPNEHSLPIEERHGSSTLDSKEHVVGKEAHQLSALQNTEGRSSKCCSSIEFSSKSIASNAGVLTSPLSQVSPTRFSEAASRSASESVHTSSGVHSLTGELSYMSKSSVCSLEVVDYVDADMPFFDPIEVIQCNNLGGRYTSQAHDVTLKIPSGAIPQGINARIEFGVTLHGPFSFPANTRPISPIIWLCIQQPQLRFLKPIELKLPHYLDLSGEDNIQSLQLKYLKAPHDCDKTQTFHFCDTQDGEVIFRPRSPYGTIHTQHFCYICLVADPQYDLTPSSCYFLMRVVPRPITSTAWDINFFVGHYLQTFIESVKRQYRGGREFKISFNKFKFKTEVGSEPKIAIHFTQSLHGGWQLALESGSEIPAAEVDIWTTDPSHFDSESIMLNSYPPRFTIEVSGEGATETSVVEVSFTGVNDCHKLNTSLSLPLVNKASHNIGGLSRLSVAPGSIVPVQLHGHRSYSVPAHPMLPKRYSYPGISIPRIGAGQQDPNTPTDEEFEEVAAEVIAKLSNNWNILQTYLGIPLNMQAEIDQERTLRLKVLRSLQAWRALNHGQATRSKLAECVRRTDPALQSIALRLEKGSVTIV